MRVARFYVVVFQQHINSSSSSSVSLNGNKKTSQNKANKKIKPEQKYSVSFHSWPQLKRRKYLLNALFSLRVYLCDVFISRTIESTSFSYIFNHIKLDKNHTKKNKPRNFFYFPVGYARSLWNIFARFVE